MKQKKDPSEINAAEQISMPIHIESTKFCGS